MNTLTSCTLVALVAATTTGCIIIPDWKKNVRGKWIADAVASVRFEGKLIAEVKPGRSSLQFARGVDAELLFLEAEWSGR